jgi:hypothetical protein
MIKTPNDKAPMDAILGDQDEATRLHQEFSDKLVDLMTEYKGRLPAHAIVSSLSIAHWNACFSWMAQERKSTQ